MRSRTIAALLVLLVPSFAVTAAVTRLFHEHERALADERFARGTAALSRGDAPQAVEALRDALSLYHVSPPTRLRLAQALIASGRVNEARSHLLTLRDRQPGDATVALELARLAAGEGDTANAVHYYADAIEGAWKAEPERRRRETRLELAELLVRTGNVARAQAELTLAAADLSNDAAVRLRVASLLSRVGAHDRAFDIYRATLGIAPANPAALAGAGHEALALARYATARSYLAKALGADPANATVRDALAFLSSMTALDPYARGLRSVERARRAHDAWAYAGARLVACRAVSTGPRGDELQPLLDDWLARDAQTTVKTLARKPDQLDDAMEFVFGVEERTRSICGEPTGADRALLLIGRDRRAVER
jgi:tetratricopeptide (TPR) repeat protein